MSTKLLRPLDYLRIKHPQKYKYDYWIPLILALSSIFLFWVVPIKPNIFGDESLTSLIGGLLQILIGFYIVSLSAIATFNKRGMDASMPGDPPTLKTSYRGEIQIVKLTRRRFLCLLFGYLSFVSIMIYFFGGIFDLLKENFSTIPVEYIIYFKYLFLFIYFSAFFNLMVTTFLGLYYMVDRIHRSDPTFIERPLNDIDQNKEN